MNSYNALSEKPTETGTILKCFCVWVELMELIASLETSSLNIQLNVSFKVAQKQDTHPGLARPEIMCVKRCCESEERGKAC